MKYTIFPDSTARVKVEFCGDGALPLENKAASAIVKRIFHDLSKNARLMQSLPNRMDVIVFLDTDEQARKLRGSIEAEINAVTDRQNRDRSFSSQRTLSLTADGPGGQPDGIFQEYDLQETRAHMNRTSRYIQLRPLPSRRQVRLRIACIRWPERDWYDMMPARSFLFYPLEQNMIGQPLGSFPAEFYDLAAKLEDLKSEPCSSPQLCMVIHKDNFAAESH